MISYLKISVYEVLKQVGCDKMMRQLTEEYILQETETNKREYESNLINSIYFCSEEEILLKKNKFPTFHEKISKYGLYFIYNFNYTISCGNIIFEYCF